MPRRISRIRNTGEIIVRTNEFISYEHCQQIAKAGIKGAYIRSVLTCKTRHGVCAKCYGSPICRRASW